MSFYNEAMTLFEKILSDTNDMADVDIKIVVHRKGRYRLEFRLQRNAAEPGKLFTQNLTERIHKEAYGEQDRASDGDV